MAQPIAHPLAAEVHRALTASTLVETPLPTSSKAISSHAPSSSSEQLSQPLSSPTPASSVVEEKASDTFMADLATISGILASSPLLYSRSSKRSLSDPLTSSSKKKRPCLMITPLDQSPSAVAVPPPFPQPSDVPLDIRVNPNPYGMVVKALPSSSSHSSLPLDDVLLQTLKDNGLECPEASTSSPVQLSFLGHLANIDEAMSAKLCSSFAPAED